MYSFPIRSLVMGAVLAGTGAPLAAHAQGIPSVELEATTDYRSRGLSWSDGDPALRAAVDVPVTSAITLSAQGVTLREASRHGGADAGFELAASYSAYAGLIDWRGAAVAHVFAGGQGDLNYGEAEAGLGASLGPARVDLSASYAPSQDAIGGSNLYARLGASVGIPATPFLFYGHVGHSSGSDDGTGRANRLRPAGDYADWAVGTEYYFAPVSLALTYSDTDIHRSDLRVPVLDHHYGEKLVASAIMRF